MSRGSRALRKVSAELAAAAHRPPVIANEFDRQAAGVPRERKVVLSIGAGKKRGLNRCIRESALDEFRDIADCGELCERGIYVLARQRHMTGAEDHASGLASWSRSRFF